MIGFIEQLLTEHVLKPQADVDDKTRRAVTDLDGVDVDASPIVISVLGVSTSPQSGGTIDDGLELRHTVDVAFMVEWSADGAETKSTRDAVCVDLVRRTRQTTRTMMAAHDDVTGQYVTRISWSVSYVPLTVNDRNEWATITYTIDTQLDD